MIDKFECEYLDVLTGACSQLRKGIIRGDGGCTCDITVDVIPVSLELAIIAWRNLSA